MGKAKKGKKGAKDGESGDEMEIDTQPDDLAGKKVKSQAKDELHGDNDDEVSTKKKKGKKDKKKVGDVSDAESGEEESVLKVSEKVKGKKTKKPKTVESSDDENAPPKSLQTNKKAGFSVLLDDNDSASEPEVVSEPEEVKPVKKSTKSDNADINGEEKTAGKKGKKVKKKKQDDDDDDIESMLAELALEYSGVKKEEVIAPVSVDTSEEPAKKVKTKGKVKSITKDSIDSPEINKEVIDGEEIESTVKSAAQKKKEKKERDRLKKLTEKQEEVKRTDSVAVEASPEPEATTTMTKQPAEDAEDGDAGDDAEKKKKKKKGKDGEDDKKDKAKGPNKKMIAAMQEALKKAKEEEEAFIRAEEDRIRLLEEVDKAKEEALRVEQERRDKKRLKDKERKERLKSEGKLLTAKQKIDRARAQAMLDSLKAQGMDLPNVGEKKAARPGTRIRGGKPKPQTTAEAKSECQESEQKVVEVEIVDEKAEVNVEEVAEAVEEEEEEEEGVRDAWDAESSEEEDEEEEEETSDKATVAQPAAKSKTKAAESGDSSDDDDSDDDSEEEEDHRTDAEKKREKALARIQQRRVDAEAGKTLEHLRAAVVCVLGHVDTGKTKILDKLRRTNVQDGEAGGITQQIGATNVPIENIKEQTRCVRNFADFELKIPGLLIIDTPGHESFSNLRSRGSSLCDIAILVVDIMHGIEPQTLESINLLKSKKTPFVVALNKIDRLYDWQTMARKDIRDVLKAQAANTQLEFEQRVKEVVVQFAEQGLNASLFHENPDIRSYVSLVPTSAITGEGIPNLLALIIENCQNMLAKRLMFSEELQATVLEVKAISGLGTTIDAILMNGRLREGDTVILAGTDGPIVTQIRSLLMPQPMKELRVKNAYVEYKEIKAAQGVKIAAKDLEKAIAGLNMQVAQKPDEVEILREEVAKELRHALSNIKLQDRGVYVQASTLGSLEALLEFLKTSKIPYSNIRIGPVVKKDVMKASTMLEHDSQYATILAFDVKIEKDAQDMADNLGVKIFQADIIYHLFDKFIAYRDELKQKKRDEFKHIAVFPCKLKILPQFIFNSRDPIVMGVMVEAGIVREGTPICVPTKDFVEVGVIRSIENNKKNVETARKGQEVCIKIEAIPGEAPKMFGRHFDENDFLVSKISRASIDACKDYFRDDLVKADWELMVELKKQFEIL